MYITKKKFWPPWTRKRGYEWLLLTQKRDLLAFLQALITAFNNLLSRKKWVKNQTVISQNISLAGVDWVSANGAGNDASACLLHHLGVEDSRDHREHCHHAGDLEKSFVEWGQFLDISGEFFWRKKLLQKLRERMHSRQVFNQSVCNCHEDSELVSTLVCLFLKVFVKNVYSNLTLAV